MEPSKVKEIQQNFLKEVADANDGKKTSLPFIVHQIPDASLVKDGEQFQVMVIGGSVCRRALMEKQKDKVRILKQEPINPTFLKKYQDLPDFIERNLYPEISVLAINFAFPMTPIFEDGKLDGILVFGTKEYTFPNIVGKKVGKEIEKQILAKQKRKVKVSVANDTICLLMSGLTKFSWDSLVGGIVGTGVNFAMFLDEHRLVNLEAANFNKFELSTEVKELDKTSSRPGEALLEKEVSGAYLYKIFNLAIEKNSKFNQPAIVSTQELDHLMLSDDKEVAKLAKSIMERSSELVTTEVGGISLFIDKLRSKKELVFIMEGSLFWIGLGYKRHVKELLEKTLPKFEIKFAKIDNSTILGAAKLVA